MISPSRKAGLLAFLTRAALAFAILNLASCGIPAASIQLIAPAAINEAGVQYFRFSKITDGASVEPEFRGFELYYRFYDVTETPQFPDTFEELATYGYRRVNAATDVVYPSLPSKPLILVDINDWDDIFTVKVDFSNTASPYPTITAAMTDDAIPVALDVPIDIQDIRRGIPDESPSDKYEQFFDYEELDDDIQGLDWSEFQLQGKLVLYVLSYGFSFAVATFGETYSEPVYLGDILQDFVP